MKESLKDSAQPLSRLDKEFEGPRLRFRHVILVLSTFAGVFAAAAIKAEIQKVTVSEENEVELHEVDRSSQQISGETP